MESMQQKTDLAMFTWGSSAIKIATYNNRNKGFLNDSPPAAAPAMAEFFHPSAL